uniref:Uncharacterized protein n=1 Tax=Callorhinchus milii TaxID=7868 RepID=A0A4W3HSQ9_CALMI
MFTSIREAGDTSTLCYYLHVPTLNDGTWVVSVVLIPLRSLTVNDIFSPDGKRSMYQKRELEKPWSNYRPLLTEAAQDWSTFISRCGEFRIPCEASRELHYSGYAVRYLKPNVTQSWRYSLQSEPTLTQYDQMPIPVSTL